MHSKTVLASLVAALMFILPAMAQETPVGTPPTPAAPDAATIKKAAEKAWTSQNFKEAVKAYREVVKLEPANALAWHHLGYALHSEGQLDEALQAHLKTYEFNSRVKPTGAYNAACVYALKKNKDEAFTWLGKAVEAGFSQVDTMEQDSDLETLRDDPRYKEMLKKVEAAAEKSTAVQPFNQVSTRGSTRIAYFGNKGGAGQIQLDWGKVNWKDEHEKNLEDPKFVGQRWRLGADSWTHLDTSLDVEIGTAKLAPGDYYLTIERSKTGEFILTFLDPKEIRKQKLDAFQAPKTTGGISTAMKYEKTSTASKDLDITCTTEENEPGKGTLTIHFGPHVLTCPITIKMVP